MEWSQRPLSGKAMAQFAGRYPDPHLRLLLDAITHETKENVLPPRWEATAKTASEKVARGDLDMDAALDRILTSFAGPSAAELATSILGNLILMGDQVEAFKRELDPFCSDIVDAVQRTLRPAHPRLCGRSAGLLCNLLRLGGNFKGALQERCPSPVLSALRESCAEDQPVLLQSREEVVKCRARLLGALTNLALCPDVVHKTLSVGALGMLFSLIDVDVLGQAVDDAEEEGSWDVASRALTLVSRIMGVVPSCLDTASERKLLWRLDQLLASEALTSFKDGHTTSGQRCMNTLDTVIRLVTILLTKTPGALQRLAGVPRIQEVPDSPGEADLVPSVGLHDVVSKLVTLTCDLQPAEHVGPDEQGSVVSKIRGNLALLFAALCEAQSHRDALPELAGVGLMSVVGPFIEYLRRERGATQHNAGVCVTQFAQNARYRERVRELNGMESLHQIHLPRVTAQQAEASRQHRLRGMR